MKNVSNTWSSLGKNHVLFDSVADEGMGDPGHTQQISFTNFIFLPEHFRLVWPRDLKTILWEVVFPAPGELTHKAPDV